MIPGKNPASMIPSKNLQIINPAKFVMNIMDTEMIPQDTMILAIHREGVARFSIKLLGISNTT